QTATFIRYGHDSGVYRNLQAQASSQRLPALQTRLKAELRSIFRADYWAQSLELLDKLGALSCLHPSLTVDADLWLQMHRVSRWQQCFADALGKELEVEPWLARLEVLLAQTEARLQIAENLQLPPTSIQRLQQLQTVENLLLEKFQKGIRLRASLVYQTLQAYELPILLLVSVRHPQQIGTHIWRYITQFIHVKPPISGHELKRLGYPPGPLYRSILTDLTHAVLDGYLVGTPAAITHYLEAHYPRS
ncbi:MAG: poly(A) polymerase, partial [Moorea sp. SIO3C2]|nr:poly(A) polymerase [Moorena sp. SIO3C2]